MSRGMFGSNKWERRVAREQAVQAMTAKRKAESRAKLVKWATEATRGKHIN